MGRETSTVIWDGGHGSRPGSWVRFATPGDWEGWRSRCHPLAAWRNPVGRKGGSGPRRPNTTAEKNPLENAWKLPYMFRTGVGIVVAGRRIPRRGGRVRPRPVQTGPVIEKGCPRKDSHPPRRDNNTNRHAVTARHGQTSPRQWSVTCLQRKRVGYGCLQLGYREVSVVPSWKYILWPPTFAGVLNSGNQKNRVIGPLRRPGLSCAGDSQDVPAPDRCVTPGRARRGKVPDAMPDPSNTP